MPFAAVAFVIASAASMGIPGFSGFAAEITILIGAWKAYPLAVWISGLGMVLVAAFTLRALKTFFDDVPTCDRGGFRWLTILVSNPTSKGASPWRRNGGQSAHFRTLAVGLYPKFLLDRISPRSRRCAFFNEPISICSGSLRRKRSSP